MRKPEPIEMEQTIKGLGYTTSKGTSIQLFPGREEGLFNLTVMPADNSEPIYMEISDEFIFALHSMHFHLIQS